METRVPRGLVGWQSWDRAGVLAQPGVKALVLVGESGPVVVKEVESASLHCRSKGGVPELKDRSWLGKWEVSQDPTNPVRARLSRSADP